MTRPDDVRHCPQFIPDDEDEWGSDEDGACENCHYRRWTRDGFECVHPAPEDDA
jgi:hypothetical protein